MGFVLSWWFSLFLSLLLLGWSKKSLWGSPRELLWALPAPRYRGGRSHPETSYYIAPFLIPILLIIQFQPLTYFRSFPPGPRVCPPPTNVKYHSWYSGPGTKDLQPSQSTWAGASFTTLPVHSSPLTHDHWWKIGRDMSRAGFPPGLESLFVGLKQ